jgi:hypothetical protein
VKWLTGTNVSGAVTASIVSSLSDTGPFLVPAGGEGISELGVQVGFMISKQTIFTPASYAITKVNGAAVHPADNVWICHVPFSLLMCLL